MPRKKQLDPTVLEAALEGLEIRLQEVNQNISEVKKMMGGRATAAQPKAKPARTLTAAARKRISDAQKRRWARQKGTAGGRKKRAAKRSAAPAETPAE